MELCSIDELIRETLQELFSMGKAREVGIEYHCEAHSRVLAVDRIKLKQALLNLFKNAIEASPCPGIVDVVLSEKADMLRSAVTDPVVLPRNICRVCSPHFFDKRKGEVRWSYEELRS